MLKRLGVTAALVAATGFLNAAIAASVFTGGGAIIQIKNRSDTVARTTIATTWSNFTNLGLAIPTGNTRLVTARFTAESQCAGTSGWCSVRLIAQKRGTATTVALNPASDIDYAFDSAHAAPDDLWESHSIERSARLPAGTWDIFVQWRVVNNPAYFRLDDWHFRLEIAQ